MKDKYILTAESVTAGHPDKLCDTIADNVLDACLKEDPNARVACEVLATAGKILVAGELRTTASPDVEAIVRQTVQRAGYDCNYHVEVRLHTQSPDIADAVDGETLGAGDQGTVLPLSHRYIIRNMAYTVFCPNFKKHRSTIRW